MFFLCRLVGAGAPTCVFAYRINGIILPLLYHQPEPPGKNSVLPLALRTIRSLRMTFDDLSCAKSDKLVRTWENTPKTEYHSPLQAPNPENP